MSGKSSKRSRTGNGTPVSQSQTVRDQKRAQFEEPRRRSSLYLILAGVALVAVAVIAVVLVAHRGGATETAATSAAPGGDVKVALSGVSDGQVHFYSYDAGGTEVKYFVLKRPDGSVRAALDACEVCYPQKKGYRQEGGAVVCNNCGRRFSANMIDVQRGGCNPIPLTRQTKGGYLVLKASDLQAGVQYFQ